MDRQIVYVGAVPLDTDHLLQSRNTMVALGALARMTIGDATPYADGFACGAGNGMSIVVGPGSMTTLGVVDAGFFGSLPPDGDPVVKLGINSAPTTLVVTGAGTMIVSGQVVEVSAGSQAIAYFNAANPAQTLIGPDGNGNTQASVLQQRVVFAISAPSAIPSGFQPLWQLLVPPGTTQMTPAMITMAPGAPFVPVKLPQAAPLQSPAFTGLPTAPTATVGDATNLLATTQFVANSMIRNRAAWGTSGTFNWTCPTGVSVVLARLWGAGGAGGTGAGGAAGGGGGGGGYGEMLIQVTPGTSYAVMVGSGTTGSSATAFGTLATVSGGGAGGAGTAGLGGAGGSAGKAASAGIALIGSLGVGPGQAGFSFASAPIGGAGGPSCGASGGPICFGGAGGNGLWPGGGGSGGATGGGGQGADGLLVLEWLG